MLMKKNNALRERVKIVSNTKAVKTVEVSMNDYQAGCNAQSKLDLLERISKKWAEQSEEMTKRDSTDRQLVSIDFVISQLRMVLDS